MSSNLEVIPGPRGAFQIILCSRQDVYDELCPRLKQSGVALSDLSTKDSKVPRWVSGCFCWDSCWCSNSPPLMLLVRGQVSLQMSEELMLQWGSAAPGTSIS